ncbi:MAG: very short patch repair endonuclease [Polaromonas sp.]
MPDIVDAATRSRMMAGIQSKNTKPETIIRKGLHARGFRYSLHPKGIPGKPDIVMRKWRVVIFVHGCFWHRHGCYLSKIPTTNAAFWDSKLAANQRRDNLVKQQLAGAGWRIATVWECAIRGKYAIENLPLLLDRLTLWIRSQAESLNLEIAAPDLLAPTRSANASNKTK